MIEGIGNHFVAFGYKSIPPTVIHLGASETLEEAKRVAVSSHHGGKAFGHVGVAKVTHPQQIWFLVKGNFKPVDQDLVWDIITLLGV